MLNKIKSLSLSEITLAILGTQDTDENKQAGEL